MFVRLVIRFIPFAVIISCTALFVFISIQQFMRHYGDEPQVQVAQDIANGLSNGQKLQIKQPTDIEQSLASFIIIYDPKGHVVTSGALLDNKTPVLPQGILQTAQKEGIDRVTWEPKSGIRIATIAVAFNGKQNGVVVVGRSLKEVEIWEEQLKQEVSLFWVGSLILIFLLDTVLLSLSRPFE